jgi:predicted nucleic acid-binding protein
MQVAKWGNSLAVRLPSAVVEAAALEADCDTLYSEDMQDGQVIDGRVAIRNPFRE